MKRKEELDGKEKEERKEVLLIFSIATSFRVESRAWSRAECWLFPLAADYDYYCFTKDKVVSD